MFIYHLCIFFGEVPGAFGLFLHMVYFLSMNVDYLSLYLILWFHSSELFSSCGFCNYFVTFIPKAFNTFGLM